MPNHRDTAIGNGVQRWLARLLITSGVAILAWCAYFLFDAYQAQRAAERELESVTFADHRPAETTGASSPAARSRLPIAAPARGAAIARISIPQLKLSAVVLHGSDDQTLRRGPGHLENTALPGEAGNSVIAGHRDTFFRPVRNIKVGDDIYMETPSGRFHYRVATTRVVKPQDVSVLNPTDEPVLTLITCFPFWVLGDAPDRFIVRAVGVPEPTGTTFASQVVRAHEAYPVPAPPRQAVATAPLTEEAAVRRTLDRFRLAYNSRLASHPENGARPLSFSSCEVIIDGVTASAACSGPPNASDGEESGSRNFTLQRAAGGWAIRSVVAR